MVFVEPIKIYFSLISPLCNLQIILSSCSVCQYHKHTLIRFPVLQSSIHFRRQICRTVGRISFKNQFHIAHFHQEYCIKSIKNPWIFVRKKGPSSLLKCKSPCTSQFRARLSKNVWRHNQKKTFYQEQHKFLRKRIGATGNEKRGHIFFFLFKNSKKKVKILRLKSNLWLFSQNSGKAGEKKTCPLLFFSGPNPLP